MICNDRPLLSRRFGAFLGEDGVDQRENDLALAFACVGERVPYEVHAAALPRRFEDFGDRRLKPEMSVGDDQFCSA